MSARLALVARVLLGAGLDRLAIGHARRRGLDRDVVAAGQLVDRHLEMHFALALDQELMGLAARFEGERRILLDDLVQGAR